jgi:hypothetical protein
MSAELAVLVIHGMGSQAPDFAEDMIEELNERVDDLGKDPETIAWKPIYWANILEGRQREEVSKLFVSFLEEFDIEVLNMDCLDVKGGWDAAIMPPDEIKEAVESTYNSDAQAVLVPDSALPTLNYVQEMEEKLQTTIISANAVSLWKAMVITGETIPVEGFGKLLSQKD